jgi:[protein-PII] uridylyltransferase
MDTFIIQDHNAHAVTDPETIRHIEASLVKALKSDSIYRGGSNKRTPRRLKAFDRPTEIRFEQDYLNNRTVMEISAMDMPGLLSVIANVIARLNINITHAKISTLGEKIDDIFYLSTAEGKNITDQSILDRLETRMVEALEAKKAA